MTRPSARRAPPTPLIPSAIAALAVLMLLALAACGDTASDDGEPRAMSPSEAQEGGDGTRAQVTGFLVATPEQPVRLCEALLESFPPQCGRPHIDVEGVDLASVADTSEEQGTVWTNDVIELTGVIQSVRLVVDSK